MSSAARQRLLRARATGQLTFGGELDDILRGQPAPDADTQTAFAHAAQIIERQMATAADPWSDSPYRWVKQLPARTRGTVGGKLVRHWLSTRGLAVTDKVGPGHHLVVEGVRLEVKLSTLWESGDYTFQAIRDGQYDAVALLGLSPHQAHLWVVPRDAALAACAGGWITVPALMPPAWMSQYGGNPADAAALLRHERNTPA